MASGAQSSPSTLPMHGGHLYSGLIGSASIPATSQPSVEPGELCCPIFNSNPVAQSNFDAANRAISVALMHVDEYVVAKDSLLKPLIIISESVPAYGDFDVDLEQDGSTKKNPSLAIWNIHDVASKENCSSINDFQPIIGDSCVPDSSSIICLPSIIGVTGG